MKRQKECGALRLPSILAGRQSCLSPETRPDLAKPNFTVTSFEKRMSDFRRTSVGSGVECREETFMRTIPLKDVMNDLSPERRRKVEAETARLIAEEMSLQELRRAMDLTQKRLARKLKIGQEGVSRLEKRSDLLISTLRGYIEATGGRLELMASFPGRPAVSLQGFGSESSATRRSSIKRLAGKR